MFVFPIQIKRASFVIFLAVFLSGSGRLSAQKAPPLRVVEGMFHTDWLVLPAGTAADLLRKSSFNRMDAGGLREEVLNLIRSGQGRVAAQDVIRLQSGYQEWSAGTGKKWPHSYTGPRMAKEITVNEQDETTDPVEPALVHTTTSVFTGRRSKVEFSYNDDNSLYGGLLLEWFTPQGSITWGQGPGTKTFPVTHQMRIRADGPHCPGRWILAGMVTPPVPEENLDSRTGAVYTLHDGRAMLVFAKMEPDPAPDLPPVAELLADLTSPGCLVEFVTMEEAESAELLDRFPSFTDPALHAAVARLKEEGRASLMETLWVAGGRSAGQQVESQLSYQVPDRYELIIPWKIQRTLTPLQSLGPVRKPWWLAPEAMNFQQVEAGRRVTFEGNNYQTTGGLRAGATLDISGQQLTGMMPMGLPGMEMSAPIWQGVYSSLHVGLIPGQPTVVRTYEAPALPSAKPWITAPASGRKGWLILTLAAGR